MSSRLLRAVATALPVLFAGACQVAPPAPFTGQVIDISFTNSFNDSLRTARVFVPVPAGDTVLRPLLVYAHYYGGNEKVAQRLGYYDECLARGWYCICPASHGSPFPQHPGFGTHELQHDILDAVAHMRATYPIDTTRIYIAGRSMGGQTAELMAAKHPDLFAAAVAGQGVAELKMLADSSTKYRGWLGRFVCGGPYHDSTRFEYERRSPTTYARNLAYVPIRMWHGTQDREVSVAHTEKLYALLSAVEPRQQPPLYLIGAPHAPVSMQASWVCDQLALHCNTSDRKLEVSGRWFRELDLTLDEDGRTFWLEVGLRDTTAFATITASLTDSTLTVTARNAARVAVHTDRLAKGIELASYRADFDGPATLQLVRGGEVEYEVMVTGTQSGTFEAE